MESERIVAPDFISTIFPWRCCLIAPSTVSFLNFEALSAIWQQVFPNSSSKHYKIFPPIKCRHSARSGAKIGSRLATTVFGRVLNRERRWRSHFSVLIISSCNTKLRSVAQCSAETAAIQPSPSKQSVSETQSKQITAHHRFSNRFSEFATRTYKEHRKWFS